MARIMAACLIRARVGVWSLLLPVLLAITALVSYPSYGDDTKITVWKSPTCGCCTGWVDYLSERGFDVTTHDVDDVTHVKHELGLSNPHLHSCHTAKVDGYVIEGHVPVSDIRRLLKERPDIVGLTAPGMPMMSPGMHSIEPKDYDVLQFDQHQNTRVFSRH